MSESESPAGGKQYTIGNVGAGARIIQGDYNTWIEDRMGALPEGGELAERFQALVERLETAEDLDEDARALATEKTMTVVDALAQAPEEPGTLKRALVDAKTFLSNAAGWAWDELSGIVSSEAAQKTISTITDVGTRAAIQALVAAV